MVRKVELGDRWIGEGEPTFVIAEAGVNHNGNILVAKKLVDAAAEAGADAIKFQTFVAEKLVSKRAPKPTYQIRTTGNGTTQYEMLRRLQLTARDFKQLKEYCDEVGIMFLSTPYDTESADFLEELGVEAFKVASCDITNIPLLEHLARKKKPIILSTGASTLGDIENALATLYGLSNEKIILLHCVTSYPAKFEHANLRVLKTLRRAFQLPVGYSDHTQGYFVPIAAVALGAVAIEKHFTLDRSMEGPDQPTSLEPGELRLMIEGIRIIEKALGNYVKQLCKEELEARAKLRRSIVAAVDIPKGSTLTEDMLDIKRPGTGIPPVNLKWIIGAKVKRDIAKDELLTWDDLERTGSAGND